MSKLWAHLYNSVVWKQIRQRQLDGNPLCSMCEAEGRVTLATVCDHITPHRGSKEAFYAGPFQSLCKMHHDVDKQMLEKSGRKKVKIGLDGYPVDV